jgi:hypothetical protein
VVLNLLLKGFFQLLFNIFKDDIVEVFQGGRLELIEQFDCKFLYLFRFHVSWLMLNKIVVNFSNQYLVVPLVSLDLLQSSEFVQFLV